MDTQSKVTVKALGPIIHGIEGQPLAEYNKGDTFEVTTIEAKQLLQAKVVEVSDGVADQVAKATAEPVAEPQAQVADVTSDNTVATNGNEVTTVQVTANPSPDDISATLSSVELQ